MAYPSWFQSRTYVVYMCLFKHCFRSCAKPVLSIFKDLLHEKYFGVVVQRVGSGSFLVAFTFKVGIRGHRPQFAWIDSPASAWLPTFDIDVVGSFVFRCIYLHAYVLFRRSWPLCVSFLSFVFLSFRFALLSFCSTGMGRLHPVLGCCRNQNLIKAFRI